MPNFFKSAHWGRFFIIASILFLYQNYAVTMPWYIQGDMVGMLSFIASQLISSLVMAMIVELIIWSIGSMKSKKVDVKKK